MRGFERDTLGSGAVAGFATGLFSIPEGMAYAQLAGVNRDAPPRRVGNTLVLAGALPPVAENVLSVEPGITESLDAAYAHATTLTNTPDTEEGTSP